MKSEKIRINKTAETPDGVEIEIIKPEHAREGRLISFMLPSLLREAKRQGRITWDLPERFKVEHRGEGTFVVNRLGADGDYYALPRPCAIVGIRVRGTRFDLVHAELPATARGGASASAGSASSDAEASSAPDAAADETDAVAEAPEEEGETLADTTEDVTHSIEDADDDEQEAAVAGEDEAEKKS
ncbi:MAG: hypothetical protein CMJ18_18085 [Phycisphaeraceae bacterium]|nr:hypothetical protein [Phycisphaeraceae bacterium]